MESTELNPHLVKGTSNSTQHSHTDRYDELARPSIIYEAMGHLSAIARNYNFAKILTFVDFVSYACHYIQVLDKHRHLLIRFCWTEVVQQFLLGFRLEDARSFESAYPLVLPRVMDNFIGLSAMFLAAQRVWPVEAPNADYGPSNRIPSRRFPARIGGPNIDGLRCVLYKTIAEASRKPVVRHEDLVQLMWTALSWAGRSSIKLDKRSDVKEDAYERTSVTPAKSFNPPTSLLPRATAGTPRPTSPSSLISSPSFSIHSSMPSLLPIDDSSDSEEFTNQRNTAERETSASSYLNELKYPPLAINQFDSATIYPRCSNTAYIDDVSNTGPMLQTSGSSAGSNTGNIPNLTYPALSIIPPNRASSRPATPSPTLSRNDSFDEVCDIMLPYGFIGVPNGRQLVYALPELTKRWKTDHKRFANEPTTS